MDLRLDGKRVVLTAGGAGIGRVTLQTFFDAGARLVTCDVDQAALDKLRGELPEVPAIRADVAAGGGCRPPVRARRGAARRPRHPDQQRRHRRADRADRGDRARRLAALPRGQPHRPVSLRAPRRADAQGRGRRRDRQSVLGRRPLRLRAPDPVLRLEMGGGRPHQGARDRARAGSDPGQRDLPGRGRGRSDQPGDRRQGQGARRRVRGDVRRNIPRPPRCGG